MKRAKMLLAAIAVFAIVGGVYASKAKRGAQSFCSATFGPTIKGTLVDNLTITTTGGYYANCTSFLPSFITKSTRVTVQD